MLIQGSPNVLYAPQTPGAFGGLNGLGSAASIVDQLPSDWSSYTAADKINYFNVNAISPADLMAVGVSADDIAWMQANGYIGSPAQTTAQTVTQTTTQTVTQADQAAPAAAAAVVVGNVTLPADWSSYGADQKITFFNENNVTAAQLQAAGVSLDDLTWMQSHGYTGEPASVTHARKYAEALAADEKKKADAAAAAAAAKAAADAAAKVIADAAAAAAKTATTKAQTTMTTVFKAPAGWDTFTADEKISYFNQNAITEGALLSAGVSVADINWMKDHGYTGKPAGSTATTTTTGGVGAALPLILAAAAAYFLGS